MPIIQAGAQVVAVQIKIIRREGDVETMQAIDVPVRNPYDFDMDLETSMYNVSMALNVRIDPQYSIAYVIRDQRAVDESGELSPYRDGIYSEQDVAGIKARLQLQHEREKIALEKQIRKLLKRVRTTKS